MKDTQNIREIENELAETTEKLRRYKEMPTPVAISSAVDYLKKYRGTNPFFSEKIMNALEAADQFPDDIKGDDFGDNAVLNQLANAIHDRKEIWQKLTNGSQLDSDDLGKIISALERIPRGYVYNPRYHGVSAFHLANDYRCKNLVAYLEKRNISEIPDAHIEQFGTFLVDYFKAITDGNTLDFSIITKKDELANAARLAEQLIQNQKTPSHIKVKLLRAIEHSKCWHVLRLLDGKDDMILSDAIAEMRSELQRYIDQK